MLLVNITALDADQFTRGCVGILRSQALLTEGVTVFTKIGTKHMKNNSDKFI